jgi:hypothetical protein
MAKAFKSPSSADDTANDINRRFTPMDADRTTSKKGCCCIGVHLRPSAVASAVAVDAVEPFHTRERIRAFNRDNRMDRIADVPAS